MPGPPLILAPGLKATCVVLQVVPLPGVGAIVAGSRNPHSRLVGRGTTQALLVLFGSWPLILPGAVGLVWAVWDAMRIARAVPPPAWSEPTPDADPATLRPTRSERQAARAVAREARRQARMEEQERRRQAREQRADEGTEDDTRWMP